MSYIIQRTDFVGGWYDDSKLYSMKGDALMEIKARELKYGDHANWYRILEVDPKMADKTPGSPYYGSLKPEPIEVIEGWGLSYARGNAVKYIARAGKKVATKEETIKDLEKAISYLKREINTLNGQPGW